MAVFCDREIKDCADQARSGRWVDPRMRILRNWAFAYSTSTVQATRELGHTPTRMARHMIELYTWNTPNGQKPAILLEELEATYTLFPIDIGAGVQRSARFLTLNPNGKIPALIDRRDGDLVELFESGAILIHLADRAGEFLASEGPSRGAALAWAFWQVGGLGPMIGQWGHFLNAEGDNTYAVERYLAESLRLFGVLEDRLANSPYLAGPDYSIADIMVFPWASGGLTYLRAAADERVPPLPATERWIAEVADRPAVGRAMARLTPLS